MNLADLHLLYALPTALLLAGLAAKFPTFLRSWRDPDARGTWVVLLWALCVFVSVTPASIHEINTVTGVPNIAAPWSYSLLTGFSGACLAMIITWRDEPSPRRRRRVRAVWVIHAGTITALWVTFLLADVPEERIYDLDTYYATTPWMREHILLYLLAFLISTLVAASMIRSWIPQVSARWLRAGLRFLQTGYAFGVLYAVAKLTAMGARWAGTDWDGLSTYAAPPCAIFGATLMAIGFLLPVIGPFLQTWPREQLAHWRLRPLARVIDAVVPATARARVSRFAPLDLRLLQRQQHIHDGLLRLAPHFDHDLHRLAYRAASAAHDDAKARGLAGAVALQAALDSYSSGIRRETSGQPSHIGSDVTDHLEAISRGLTRPRVLADLRRRALTAGPSVHESPGNGASAPGASASGIAAPGIAPSEASAAGASAAPGTAGSAPPGTAPLGTEPLGSSSPGTQPLTAGGRRAPGPHSSHHPPAGGRTESMNADD
ncbi:MAB_1171c family putative transporter [Streptomyces sp. JB150]|uniref:MAB_1171c family putative transporter n=1 Tax=Streptomyces sp. JB150 TaxID=2714844 RepID=UPI0019D25548|nr:MAB_1171c family putative transporter [Streptomyces sp. JB150]